MKYKIIATDFDGTLLNGNGILSEHTSNGLKRLKEKNYTIVGVTGRILPTACRDVDKNLFDYFILGDGSYIYDIKKDKGHYTSILDKKILEDITLFTKEKVTKIDYSNAFNYYVYKEPLINTKPYLKEIKSCDEIIEPISRITLFFKSNDLVEYYYKILKDKYPITNCFIMADSFSDEKRITITPKNISKRFTLEKLAESLNIKPSEVIFFGDGLNDLEVFDSEFCKVAMSNAFDVLKEKANFIAPPNTEDGVIKFLESFLKEK